MPVPVQAKTEEEDEGEECAKTFTAAELKTLGVRQYLEKTVVPVLQQVESPCAPPHLASPLVFAFLTLGTRDINTQ